MTDLDMLKRELDHARAVNAALPRWKKDSLQQAHQVEVQLGYVRQERSAVASTGEDVAKNSTKP